MDANEPDNDECQKPLAFGGALRYLFKDALKDFNAALELARKHRANVLTAEQFSEAVAERFRPTIAAKREA